MSRQTDRALREAAARLARITDRDSSALSAGEQVRYAAAAAVSIGRGLRQQHAPRADAAIERIWSEAEAVARAELAAAQQAKTVEIGEKAAARAEKKSKGWW
ncbi:hypothetical protein [Streptomyces sp. NPDC094049]|uniref:hypothetical protein n=1 Tax=Streptomyces sp. NPDC094049 TaxID=3154987 RepID=UPI003324904D